MSANPDFRVAAMSYPGVGTLPIHFALVIAAGLVGVAYNFAILGALRATERFGRYPAEFRAAGIGAAVGSWAWFAPGLVVRGDAITQRILGGTEAVGMFGLVFVPRFALGALSYAARKKGGLFAPMVLGSQSGLLFGTSCGHWFPAPTKL